MLQAPSDLLIYCMAMYLGQSKLVPNALSSSHGIIELPPLSSAETGEEALLILEPFIRTDAVTIDTTDSERIVRWNGESRWIEVEKEEQEQQEEEDKPTPSPPLFLQFSAQLTTAVVGLKDSMRALTPSVTLSDGSVLSLQEKFQGGTGVNMTPPPPAIMQESVVCTVKERIEVRMCVWRGCLSWLMIMAFL